MKKIVVIADTHGKHNKLGKLPHGDILIHCGDFSMLGKLSECILFLRWFNKQPYEFKIFVAGNHDFLPERQPSLFRELLKEHAPDCIYLQDELNTDTGMRIYGTPWTPIFLNWAFMANDERMPILRNLIPNDLDILICHGAPYQILDRTADGTLAGCPVLQQIVFQKNIKNVCFGHIHEAYGVKELLGVKFYNCSILNEYYELTNEPVILEMEESCESN
jgi:predicted phosphodiesterase